MTDLLIIGGGPAGLAAAYESIHHGATPLVLEALPALGGLCRTLRHAGCRFDVGPHRFFTHNAEVRELFMRVVGEEVLRVPRLTRIFYRGQYFHYPLSPLNALRGLGLGTSLGVLGSYGAAKVTRLLAPRAPHNFEEWVTDEFGRRLFSIFFRTYTEKVWGIPCTQIGAEWAGQRIKGLSLASALWHALARPRTGTVKTLVDEFLYPRGGAGAFYEQMGAAVVAAGGAVRTDAAVCRVRRDGHTVRSVTVRRADGSEEEEAARWVLSSAPLTELVAMMEPAPPEAVLAACRALRYRDHLCVNLVLEGSPFADNWIYVHAGEVAMGRICNYRNFSAAMAAGDAVSPITVEYFCFKGDALWGRSDDDLIALAIDEMTRMGLAQAAQVRGGFVVRSEKAYPVIELGYERQVATIKAWLEGFTNLLPIGRAGMFKYNNQDHSIASGQLAARTALGVGSFDPWCVNSDAEYHEAGQAE
jgi:protoporphyrinogen oxidase